jgi:hypothetical protein
LVKRVLPAGCLGFGLKRRDVNFSKYIGFGINEGQDIGDLVQLAEASIQIPNLLIRAEDEVDQTLLFRLGDLAPKNPAAEAGQGFGAGNGNRTGIGPFDLESQGLVLRSGILGLGFPFGPFFQDLQDLLGLGDG